MCGQLVRGGFSATVYNRTAAKAQGLVDAGAVLASSPGEVARNSDVVFTIVGYPSDVRSVILGEDGILANLKPGGIVVDMTTSEPALAQEIAKAAAAKGCAALDCPVAGGDEPAVEAVAPLLECMGKINKLGGPGAGQHCKMANQIGIANTMLGMCEGMLYA